MPKACQRESRLDSSRIGTLLQTRERAGTAGRGELAAAKRAAEEREAELRRAMREGEAKLRERIARLDDDNQDLRRWGLCLLGVVPSSSGFLPVAGAVQPVASSASRD